MPVWQLRLSLFGSKRTYLFGLRRSYRLTIEFKLHSKLYKLKNNREKVIESVQATPPGFILLCLWRERSSLRRLPSLIHTMKRAKSSSSTNSSTNDASQPKKKAKLPKDEDTNKVVASTSVLAAKSSAGGTSSIQEFMDSIQGQRISAGESVLDFAFKKKRVRVLTKASEVSESSTGGVLYWMSRDMRVQDNWALLYAQRLAMKIEAPLMVAFCLVPKFLDATLRHYKFLLGGLEEVERECLELDIPFRLLLGPARERIPEFVKEHNISAVVCDFSALRVPRQWVEDVKNSLSKDVPMLQVDAHNIVPVWIASDKQEYGARTIRNKINSKLPEFLSEFPPVIRHPHKTKAEWPPVDWKTAYASLECDKTVDAVEWAKPGYEAACGQLHNFCMKRLRFFHEKRNDPTMNALSGLSPWFHFGQISVQRCILEVRRFKSKYKDSVESFCEEAIVRRELADNFCYYNPNYDNLNGIADWASKSLDAHRKDKRSPCYQLKEFEQARTHEDIWNAAQLQLVHEGKMHGFMRMYWAKKILEWSESPEKALEIAIYLNDKYSLDGRDPNGYVGCMWSIGGIHDQGWAERAIFGKIRYMNYQGCKRKFDVAAYAARYCAKSAKKSA